MDFAAELGLHAVWQVLLSAVVFGLGHSSWILLRGEASFAWPAVVATSVLGGLLAVVYLVGGRNLLPAIAAHSLIDLVVEPWLMLAAVSGRWKGTNARAS